MNGVSVTFGFIGLALAAFLGGTAIGNLLGWRSLRARHFGGGYRFNWRIFLGSRRYLRWADNQPIPRDVRVSPLGDGGAR